MYRGPWLRDAWGISWGYDTVGLHRSRTVTATIRHGFRAILDLELGFWVLHLLAILPLVTKRCGCSYRRCGFLPGHSSGYRVWGCLG